MPPETPPAFYSATPDGLELYVWAKPGAAKDAVLGVRLDEKGRAWLSVSVRAVAEDGRANAGIIAFLSEWLGVRRSAIRLLHGATAPQKRFFIEGKPHALTTLLENVDRAEKKR